MAVLVIADHDNGKFKKVAFELVHYGYLVAKELNEDCIALVIGRPEDANQLGQYGAGKVLIADFDGADQFDSQVSTSIIGQVADQNGASTIILNHNSKGKSLLGRLAVRMNAGSVSGVNSVPRLDGGFFVKKGVFSGKAFAEYELKSDKRVLSLMGNTIPPQKVGSDVEAENISVDVPQRMLEVKDVKKVEGVVPLPEAELVVSAGRGMKDPANWGIVEELADVIGASTACSRPVSDTGWRPHHEHVGQTGIAIRPNLYIAIGISGAIQHLAGVNNSKVIVVINKDPEAPFFKAADYGVCADLFDVVPRLTEAVKKFKQSA